ncbi:DNA recombination protein RmuC [Mariniflexile rhizosphaerae]|uniref:DNA recombination protein RmuC n=1 Tax=unclassified Mariniflexile TaxID=2643887 RepID=UPI000CB097D1|nr:DNA recombination protein RmuC [Mariniflexile sp. TRM1-10]AXP79448.1 DNA recombination protein RmuC [Mariniflexile sp. TRM1-10]PLB19402.1 MAG: DNA recombination protein RmuC [Flavobacteriaceae bacterium FS1-H7996/R]
MNDNLILILAILISGGIGAYLGMTITKLKSKSEQSTLEERQNQMANTINELKQHLGKTEDERETIRKEKESLNAELTRKQADFENLKLKNEEQKIEVEKLQEKFTKEFENLANKILDENSKKFTVQNKDNIDAILKPLQDKIQNFEKRVEETNKEDINRSADLRRQIIGLKELNEQMTKETTNLTKALKGDTKMQGNWGELVLERVLERSGLRKDFEYFVQQSFTNDDGRRVMPDIIVHLPGDKKLIIDSKVSLVSYERYINETDESERLPHLKSHVLSVKKRVVELGEKNYHQLYQMESPDFVLLFIPIESAFAIASMEHPSLYADAFERNIIIVTPTTLLAVLKTIDTMWQNEKQKANAIEIATQAGKLYDSFVNLTDELIKVGNQIGTVQKSYENAMVKLTGKGNLIKRVENLKILGAKASKEQNQKLLKRADGDSDQD